MVITYFGDSITLGYGDPSGLGWPGRISGRLANLGVDVTHYNMGVRKDASPLLAKRWKGEAELRKLSGLDCKLVFSFGVADVFNDVPLADSLAAAESILTEASEMGEVLMVGPTPVTDEDKTAKISALSEAFGELCSKLGVPYVRVVDGMLASPLYLESLKDGDTVHPTLPGYAMLADFLLQSEPVRDFFGLE